jgi:hypothetical protein
MPDLHTLAIALHAVSATGVLIIGIILLFQSHRLRQLQLARAIVALLIPMEVFLIIAILSHLSSLPTIKQLTFGSLTILGGYLLWRAVQAVSALREPKGNQRAVI